MTFRRRGLEMLSDWEPGEWFEPSQDCLLVTTSWEDTFVLAPGPKEDDGTTLIIDPEFMPKNLKEVANVVSYRRTFPLEWDVTQYPWSIFVFDGKMTHDGPRIEMLAAGVGWTMTIFTELLCASITPIPRAEINKQDLSERLEGTIFDQITVNEAAIYDEAIRII